MRLRDMKLKSKILLTNLIVLALVIYNAPKKCDTKS